MHYQQRKNDYPSVETNFFQRYPSEILISNLILGNLTATYRKARLLFGTHSFAQAASTIEQVDFFEKNQSFLFLWGYSKYMVCSLWLSYFKGLSRANDLQLLRNSKR